MQYYGKPYIKLWLVYISKDLVNKLHLGLRMAKPMAFVYLIIQFAKRPDVDQSMQMEVIRWNDENHVVTVPAQHQIQRIQRTTVHAHQCIKRSTRTARVRPIRAN